MNLNVFIYSLLLLFAVVSCGKTGNNGGTALNEHTDKNNARNVRETEKIKERRIYYLDQTGSMEDNNNIWGDAKRSLCNSIMDLDSTTEIIVIPFTDSYHCLKPVTIGKDSVFCGSQRQNLCNEIWHLKTIKPIKTTKKTVYTHFHHVYEDFYTNRIESARNNLLIIITDGDITARGDSTSYYNEQFAKQVKMWDDVLNGNNKTYGFHVKYEANGSDSNNQPSCFDGRKHLWYKTTNSIDFKLNLLSPRGAKTFHAADDSTIGVCFTGDITSVKNVLTATLVIPPNKEPISLKVEEAKGDSIYLSFPDNVVEDLPDSCEATIEFSLDDKDSYIRERQYSFLIEKNIGITLYGFSENVEAKSHVISNWKWNQHINPLSYFSEKREDDKHLGYVRYHDEYDTNPLKARNVFTFEFGKKLKKYADENKWSPSLKLDFVCYNAQGEPIDASDFAVYRNGTRISNLEINSLVFADTLDFWMSSSLPEGTYTVGLNVRDYGIIKTMNGKAIDKKPVLTWSIEHENIYTPLWVFLWWGIILLVLLILLVWLIMWLHRRRIPRFHKDCSLFFELENTLGKGHQLDLKKQNIKYKDYLSDKGAIYLHKMESMLVKEIVISGDKKDDENQQFYDRFYNGKRIFLLTTKLGEFNLSKIVIKPYNDGIQICYNTINNEEKKEELPHPKGQELESSKQFIYNNLRARYSREAIQEVNTTK